MKSGCAVNFCDYDSLKHYDSGSFNSRYKTDLTGKLQEVKKDLLNDDLASTFLNKQYRTCKTLDELVLYRVFGLYGRVNGKVDGAKSSGGYASTEFAESLIDAKLRLALDPKWFNTKAYEEKILLPKGSIICGTSYPQNRYSIAWWGRSDFVAKKLVGGRLDNRIPTSNHKTVDKFS